MTVTGVGLRPLSATEWQATVFVSRECRVSAVTSVPEAFLASSPTASPVTSVLGTGIALCRFSFNAGEDRSNPWIIDWLDVNPNLSFLFVVITRTWQHAQRVLQSVPMGFRPLGLLDPMRKPLKTWRTNWHKLRTLSLHAMPLLQLSLP